MLNVFIGWDPREHDAYLVACSSILRHASQPVLITPLALHHLKGVVDRPIERRDGKLWCPVSQAPMATEFACSRFVVPLLQRSGWALFADCDIVVRDDITKLFALADDRYAVMCVKHDHRPVEKKKMVKLDQTCYNRKSWSSLCLWNCGHPSNRRLTKELLETWPGRYLHQFRWLDDEEIGSLPAEWNHLVGVDPDTLAPEAKLLHFTLGGPFNPGWTGGPYDHLWLQEAANEFGRTNLRPMDSSEGSASH